MPTPRLRLSQFRDNDKDRVNNENKFKTVVKNSDFTFGSEDIEISSGADIGKKTRVVVSGSDFIVATLPNIGDIDDTIIVDTDSATSSIIIVPASGVTIPNITNNAVKLSGGYKRVMLYKIAENQFRVDGNYEDFEYIADLMSHANAASKTNETNATTGFVLNYAQKGTLRSIASTDTTAGDSWAMEVESTLASGADSIVAMVYTFSAEIGAQYRIQWRERAQPVARRQRASTWQGIQAQPNFTFFTNTNWRAMDHTITASATTVELRFYSSVDINGQLGDKMQVSELQITKV